MLHLLRIALFGYLITTSRSTLSLYDNQQILADKALHAIAEHNLEQAEELYQTMLAQWPDWHQARYNYAHLLKDLNKRNEAAQEYVHILSRFPNHTYAQLGLAQCLLALGDFTNGLPGLAMRSQEIKLFPEHHWKDVDLTGQQILIRTEWGFGDVIQFIRYAQELKRRGATVIFQSYQELAPLMRTCPYIDHVVTVGDSFPDHTTQIPLLSLPQALQTEEHTIPKPIPYFSIPNEIASSWRSYLAQDKNFKIGICYQGKGDPHASPYVQKNIPLELLATLADLPGVSIYNLQRNNENIQTKQLNIYHFPANFDTENGRFIDTAAVMQSLDLVITIDTSIAHLAGALGVPVWVMLPYTSDWRWMQNRTDTPWYPSMQLFRQPKPGDWHAVLEAIKQKLQPELFVKNITKHRSKPAVEKLVQKIIADHNNIQHYFSLGYLLSKDGDMAAAQSCYQEVINRYEQAVAPFFNMAYTVRWQGKLDLAIDLYKKALLIEPFNEDIHFGIAQAYLLDGNFIQGLPAFERGRATTARTTLEKIDLQKIAYKKILIQSEWGLGDTFQFIRYAKKLKEYGAYIILQAPANLVPLLQNCPYVDEFTQGFPEHDYRIPMLSLMYQCNTTLQTIPHEVPYLFAEPTLIEEWRQKVAPDNKMRIGICWQGSTVNAYPNKNVALELFLQLADIPGVSVYSLQKMQGTEQLTVVAHTHVIHTFNDEFDTINGRFADTAAVIKNLDLVITIDTSIAHLAGALAVPVWVLLPYIPDWRWMTRGTQTPWYPTMTLFRQHTSGVWHDVIEDIIKQLKKELAIKKT